MDHGATIELMGMLERSGIFTPKYAFCEVDLLVWAWKGHSNMFPFI